MIEYINDLELMVMAHRYLYYVLAEPVASDDEYDILERTARRRLPDSSPVHLIGSSLPSSYTAEHIAYAESIRA